MTNKALIRRLQISCLGLDPIDPLRLLVDDVVEALRENAMREVQRLGQEIEQEPVAWEQFYPDIGKPQLTYPPQGIYYTPPQRTWVGLTDEEVKNLCLSVGTEPIEVRLIEAKLKERNT